MQSLNSRGLSANTLFHFTSSLDNLINILTNEFHPNFCLENLNVLLELPIPEMAIPMLSFCDIPLSQTGRHLSVYGAYGIGMTKSWGMQNGISPVLYTYPGSLPMKRFKRLMKMLGGAPTSPDQPFRLAHDFVSFLKPYEGELYRTSGTLENVRFYDEREWRFLPELPTDFVPLFLTREQSMNEGMRTLANLKLADICRVSFEPKDIKYLVVRQEEEIVPLTAQIEQIKIKYSPDDVRLLKTRVITAEQIKSDF
jgi:hypothetical protein